MSTVNGQARQARKQGQRRAYAAAVTGYEHASKVPVTQQPEDMAPADQMQHTVDQLQANLRKISADYYLIEYDIPDEILAEFPNPSWLLWRLGWRHTWSCFTIASEELGDPRFQRLCESANVVRAMVDDMNKERAANGGRQLKFRWRIIRTHPEEAAQLREIGEEQLLDYIREQHTSLITKIANADAALAEAVTLLKEAEAEGDQSITVADYERAEDRSLGNARKAVLDAADALDAAITCARRFDESERVEDLVAAFKEAVTATATAYNARLAGQLAAGRRRKPIVLSA